jgi:tRNA pseudouridine13 synthase
MVISTDWWEQAEPASTINNDAAKRIPTPPLIASKGPNTEEPSAATEAAHVDISLDGNSIPAPAESSNAAAISVSTISSEDRDLLVKYLDTSFVDQIIELDAKVQSKPDAKHTTFGSIESATITDRALRGKIHGAIRRIFESRLETESINDGIIKFTAAPKAARQNARQGGNTNGNGGAKTQNPRSQYQQQRGQVKGKVGWQELGGEHLHFSLYKENKDTMVSDEFLPLLLLLVHLGLGYLGRLIHWRSHYIHNSCNPHFR